MTTSEVSICNLALSWLGGNRITSLEDGTTEANLCAANYNPARDAVLEDRDWTFASTRCMPNRLAEPPEFGYSSAFQLPPDFIRVIRISQLADMRDEIFEWEKEKDQLLVNADVIYMRYVFRLEDPTKFSPNFVQAFAARIAADICVPLTHDKELFANYWQLYLSKLETGGAMDGMQGVNKRLQARKIIRIR